MTHEPTAEFRAHPEGQSTDYQDVNLVADALLEANHGEASSELLTVVYANFGFAGNELWDDIEQAREFSFFDSETAYAEHARLLAEKLVAELQTVYFRNAEEDVETLRAIIKKRPGQFVMNQLSRPISDIVIVKAENGEISPGWVVDDHIEPSGNNTGISIDVRQLPPDERAIVEHYKETT